LFKVFAITAAIQGGRFKMSDYRQSVNLNKAHVCRKCEEITWRNGLDFLSLDRVFWICPKCENI